MNSVATRDSQATRAYGSLRRWASRTAPESRSASLSGWPSVTDSDENTKRNRGSGAWRCIKETAGRVERAGAERAGAEPAGAERAEGERGMLVVQPELAPGQAGTGHQALELRLDHRPAPRAQAAVGVDADALGAQRAGGEQDAVAHQLGGLHLVGVHVEDAEPNVERRLVLRPQLQGLGVAGAVLRPRAEAPGVLVGQLDGQLLAALELEDAGEEQRVVAEAEVDAEARPRDALDRLVERLDEDADLVGQGHRGAALQ